MERNGRRERGKKERQRINCGRELEENGEWRRRKRRKWAAGRISKREREAGKKMRREGKNTEKNGRREEGRS